MYTQTQVNVAADALQFLREKKAQTIFAAEAPGLIARNYSPLPRKIEGGHGRPAVKRWSDLCDRQPTEAEIAAWSRIEGATYHLRAASAG